MGQFWTYQAIPEDAPLVERARTETLIGYFFCRSILWALSLRSDHVDAALRDTLWRIQEGLDEGAPFALTSEAETGASELARDVAALVSLHPGIEQRRFAFQGAARIGRAAVRGADRLHQPDAALVERLAYGGDMLAPASCDEYDNPVRIVSADEVRRGAALLRDMNPATLYRDEPPAHEAMPWIDPNTTWSENSVGGPSDFSDWRSFYAAAAAHGEAVLCQQS